MTGAVPDDVVHVGPTSGLQYVHLRAEWADVLEELEVTTFAPAVPADLYDAEEFRELAEDFPEGCFVGFEGEDRSFPVALGTGVRLHFDFDKPDHRMDDLMALAPNHSGHDPDGPWYYGTDIVVRPEFRRRGIGRELYDMRKRVCVDLDLAGIIAGGVLPGYADHVNDMSPDDYISAVVDGDLYDPTLTFQLQNGFVAICALTNYIENPAVNNAASLIVWRNECWTGDHAAEGLNP